MSQSPVEDLGSDHVLRYQQGWKALNRLLHEDRSFSGHEKNCAYLNLRGTSSAFADASFVTGLNFPDDGRGIAVADWDFDGDLDFWTSNRTAPRVRFMKNTAADETGAAFVTVRLQGDGDGTNRDAIGARLRLFIDGESVPRIRSLRTADGFLSMSSNWIHFGLGTPSQIDRLEVDWPGGGTETISGLAPKGFFLVRQGSGTAQRWTPPATRAPLEPSTPELPAESDAARVFLAARLPCPTLPVIDATAKARELDSELNGPVLVNLWASWCTPCVKELSEWSREAAKITAAGLRIIALNTDALDPSTGDPQAAAALLEKLRFPFEHHDAREQTVQNLNLLQRAVIDRWLPLPVPSSFLLDKHGEVAAIYRGPVAVATLLEDVGMLEEAADGDLRPRAVPFPGKWTHGPPSPSPLHLAAQFVDFAQSGEALKYLHRYIDRGGGSHLPESERRQHHADVLYVLGSLLLEDKQVDAARAAYEEAALLNPDDLRIRADLGRLTNSTGNLADAEQQFREALRINPDDADALRMLAFNLVQQEKFPAAAPMFARLVQASPQDAKLRVQFATVLDNAGRAGEAVEQYKQVLALSPKTLNAANGIARIRASHPDATLRNGKEALALGQRLCQMTANKVPGYLDTLAMAHAELGQFEQALETARMALTLNPDDAGVAARVALYEAGQPFRRDPP